MFILKKGGICPQCETGRLDVQLKKLSFVYKQRSKVFSNEKIFKCDVCGYEGLSNLDNKRIDRALANLRRGIDELLSCDELKSIRLELHLSKKKMAGLLSVNEKTIGRYENGKVTQSEHMVKLYRVLKAYPFVARVLNPDINVGIAHLNVEYELKPVHELDQKWLISDDYPVTIDMRKAINAS